MLLLPERFKKEEAMTTSTTKIMHLPVLLAVLVMAAMVAVQPAHAQTSEIPPEDSCDPSYAEGECDVEEPEQPPTHELTVETTHEMIMNVLQLATFELEQDMKDYALMVRRENSAIRDLREYLAYLREHRGEAEELPTEEEIEQLEQQLEQNRENLDRQILEFEALLEELSSKEAHHLRSVQANIRMQEMLYDKQENLVDLFGSLSEAPSGQD